MSEHTIVIEASNVEQRYWRDIWKFRSLFYFLAWRDILVRYKQTTIGILWSIIRPLITLLVMSFLGWLFESSIPAGTPRILLVATATLPWTFFSTAFTETANSLIANSNLLTKVYFPRIIIPISAIIVCLLDFFISLLLLLGLMAIYHFSPTWHMLLFPLFLLLAIICAMGSGLYVAALNVKYRDFRYIVPFIVQIGLYISPIAFSSSDILNNARIPEWLKMVYFVNPVVSIIDGFRWSMLGGQIPIYWPGFMISLTVSFALLILGIRYFKKTERGFADVI
jgi:lipopolysaccharide transport system permease protein